MNNRPLTVVALLIVTSACPTRVVYDDGGTGGAATGGTGGAGGQAGGPAIGGAAAMGTGGTAGKVIGGTGGAMTGGAGGFAGASMNTGTGGSAGAPATGGVGGAAGQAGAPSTGGTAGPAGAIPTGGSGGNSSKAADGQACSLPADCASGACTAFYVDLDGDGYGAGQAHGFCGSTAPIGYAAQTGDCCDTATNLAVAKLIHPGADFQTTSAGGICNITWDYDCSGTVETQTRLACSGLPDCQTYTKTFTSDLCGMAVGQCQCGGVVGPPDSLMCSDGCGPAGTLGCK